MGKKIWLSMLNFVFDQIVRVRPPIQNSGCKMSHIVIYSRHLLLKKKLITIFKTTAMTDILTIIYISQLYTLQPKNSRAIAE